MKHTGKLFYLYKRKTAWYVRFKEENGSVSSDTHTHFGEPPLLTPFINFLIDCIGISFFESDVRDYRILRKIENHQN